MGDRFKTILGAWFGVVALHATSFLNAATKSRGKLACSADRIGLLCGVGPVGRASYFTQR
jgi:hypothetical protein